MFSAPAPLWVPSRVTRICWWLNGPAGKPNWRAGFNYGRFKKKEVLDKESGYNIEVYYNTELPNELRQIQHK